MTDVPNSIVTDTSCMPISNIYSAWNNLIIATNFDEAVFACNVPTNSKRAFYIWNLDWNTSGFSYNNMCEIINKFDKVYCRSESHKKIIDAHFNINSEIKQFNIEEIYNDTNNGG